MIRLFPRIQCCVNSSAAAASSIEPPGTCQVPDAEPRDLAGLIRFPRFKASACLSDECQTYLHKPSSAGNESFPHVIRYSY
jgi:hypothetical protein